MMVVIPGVREMALKGLCIHCDHVHNPDNPCYESPTLTLADFITTAIETLHIDERKPCQPMFGNLAQPVRHRTRGGRGVVGRLV